MPTRVITANRLLDGAVVWRDAAGGWVNRIDQAAASDSDETVTRMMESAQDDEAAGIVIGPYEVEIEDGAESGTVLPAHLRERIRAGGPTIRFA